MYLTILENQTSALIEKFRSAGVNFVGPVIEETDNTLKGKVIVVTGTLKGFTRDQIAEAITSRGGKLSGSVSGKTSALVVGSNPKIEIKKAEELGIPILDEVEFQNLLMSGEIDK